MKLSKRAKSLHTSNFKLFTLALFIYLLSIVRCSVQGPVFERLYIDIQHLNVEKVDSLISDTRGIVAIGKHLCGAATDLSINCLIKKADESLGE